MSFLGLAFEIKVLRQLSRLGILETPTTDFAKLSPGPGEVTLSQDAIVEELEASQVDQYPPREYFILTHAGKPVFARYV